MIMASLWKNLHIDGHVIQSASEYSYSIHFYVLTLLYASYKMYKR